MKKQNSGYETFQKEWSWLSGAGVDGDHCRTFRNARRDTLWGRFWPFYGTPHQQQQQKKKSGLRWVVRYNYVVARAMWSCGVSLRVPGTAIDRCRKFSRHRLLRLLASALRAGCRLRNFRIVFIYFASLSLRVSELSKETVIVRSTRGVDALVGSVTYIHALTVEGPR